MSDYLYYDPESYGLETVIDFDVYEEPYEFSLVCVWRENATGKLWGATDSGCSCPVPFEDHTFPTDFVEIRNWQDVRALYDGFVSSGGYRRARPLPASARQRVKRALAKAAAT